ncbi:MAG: hypothetical protein H8E44_19155 [Planctomycetes bacterium]|nr:hypothetical protein [Planctomycetota bacterium]MBL7040858.1 hypothetical protein [Pirellulaceae bacterium]
MSRRRSLVLWLLVFLLPASVWAAGKPIAVVAWGNASNGDRKFFEYYVTARSKVVAQDRGEFLDPSEFGDYSLVVWLRGCDRKFTPAQIAAMKRYLEDGGHVLMTNGAIYGALGRSFEETPWVGARAWTYNGKRWPVEVLAKDHPYLKGVVTEGATWLNTYHGLIDHQGVSVLGQGNASVLSITEVGKGRLIFSSYGPYDARDEVAKAGIMQIYHNIVLAANPLTEHEEAKALLATNAAEKKLALWHRDWAGSTEFRLLWKPAGPRLVDMLTSLEFSSVRNEIDTAFFCIQSALDLGTVVIQTAPLRRSDGAATKDGGITTLVMGQAPEVPLQPPETYGVIDRRRRGPFYLVSPEKLPPLGKPAVELQPLEPRTIWVQIDTQGLAAGSYGSRITFSSVDGETLAVLPVKVDVAPILMPGPRIVQLRTWGGGITNDPRLLREVQRQGSDWAIISYPDTNEVKLRNTDTPLLAALRAPQTHLRGEKAITDLDFGDLWDEWLDDYLAHGVTNLGLKDSRTGPLWATAITGETCTIRTAYEEWPSDWRDACIDYYRQLQEYLDERGFGMAHPIWTDEPSMPSIEQNYLPLAKAYIEAGMGPGSHWTTAGWMHPTMTNRFIAWVRDLSMYQYGYPNLQKFLREGSVKLGDGTIVGFTRGGTGLAIRNPHASSRLGPWSIVHQGPPVHFWRTGPVWKSWLYYLDFTHNQWFRLGGVQGERLLAYGSSDHQDTSADLLTSSDWEGARDGVDDANLGRMVEWYLPRLKTRATGAWKKRLADIAAERQFWFSDKSPFPIGQKPLDYLHEPKDDEKLEYHIQTVAADSTRDIEAGKRHMIKLLREMAPHVRRNDVQVGWHDWPLVRDGQATATVVVSPSASAAIKECAVAISTCVVDDTGIIIPVIESDNLHTVQQPCILVGEAKDPPIAGLVKETGLQLDARYPGNGNYRIKRLKERGIIAILGTDAAGVARGVRNWLAFVNPQGHWLLSPNSHQAH